MARVHELLIKIDGKLSGSVNSSFKSVASKATKLNKQFKDLKSVQLGAEKFKAMESGLGKLETKLKTTKEKTLELRRAFNESKARTEALAQEFKNTGGKSQELANKLAKSREETSRLSERYEKSKASIDAVNAKIVDQKSKLDELSGSLAKAGFKTGDFEKSQQKLAAKMSIKENYKEMQERFGKAGDYAKKAMKRTAAFGAAAAVPLKFAIDEESVNAEIAKVADFKDDKQKKEVTDSLKKMITTEIPMSYQEIGELAAAGAQGGIETVDLSKFSELAAKMGVAFDMEAGEAGQKMANWKAAFGMDMNELQALGDKVNYLGNNSAASAASISNVISRVGALGEVAGVGSGEVAGLGAAMIAMGTQDDVAATGIKKVLTTLASGGNKASKAILGIGGADLSKSMKMDGAGTIIDVFEKIKALKPEEQTGALRDIFGQQNIGAIAPLLNNLDLVKEYLGMVGDKSKYAGSMQKEFDAQAGTTANQLKILRNQAVDAGMVIGSAMLPYFKKGVEKLQEMATKIKTFADENPKAMESILKIAGALAGLAVAVPTILALNNAFMGTKKAFRIVSDLTKLLEANPMAIGIMLAVGALFLLWKNWDKVKAIAGAAMDWVNSKIELGKNKVIELKNHVAEKFEAMKQHFTNAGNAVKDFFLAPLNKAKEIVGRIKEGVGGIASNIKDKVSSGIQKLTGGGNGVRAMATGGVVTRPQMALVGEGGDHEAVIPLNKDKRSEALWQYAGSRMGLLGDESRLKSINSNISSYSPPSRQGVSINMQIDARGAQKGVQEEIQNAIRYATPELKRVMVDLLRDMDRDRERVVLV
ncbi:phage tail tape measure protein [Peptoniphilus hominis (ex Hitch et al. 2025)]|uniref:Phage tail tape measure protein n=1 Tax=Peptoniphilus hominis (ex Hitch et al. 2025) TaxID=3133174 RepID=A0ABV1CDJ2_9FIRM